LEHYSFAFGVLHIDGVAVMNTLELTTAIAVVKKTAELDYLSQLLWRQHSKGELSDIEAQNLAEAINAQRQLLQSAPARRWSAPIIRRPKRSYSTKESIYRRRRQAAAGFLPPQLVVSFTLGEQSVLSVIATMVLRGGGVCAECIAKIAAIAGVSRTVVQSAIRTARQLGLLRVTERPRRGMPSLTNLIEITDNLWQQWLNKRPAKGGRVNLYKHHDIPLNYKRLSRPIGLILVPDERSGCGFGANLSKTGT